MSAKTKINIACPMCGFGQVVDATINNIKNNFGSCGVGKLTFRCINCKRKIAIRIYGE